jgi:hypothetical protein
MEIVLPSDDIAPCAAVTVGEGGRLIVNAAPEEVPPAVVTTTVAVPPVAIIAVVTGAVTSEAFTYVVASAVPFQATVVPEEVKFVPFTVRVKAPPPAAAELGLRLVIVGGLVSPEPDPPDPPEPAEPPDPHPGTKLKPHRRKRAQTMEWANLQEAVARVTARQDDAILWLTLSFIYFFPGSLILLQVKVGCVSTLPQAWASVSTSETCEAARALMARRSIFPVPSVGIKSAWTN